MALKLPKRSLGGWASEIVQQCSASQSNRVQRGALFRNLYLMGDANGQPQTYPKTNPFIDTLASYLYSPTDLRFTIAPSDPGQSDQRAMADGVERTLHAELRRGGPNAVDMKIDQAVTQSLIKGKAFLQIYYSTPNSGRSFAFDSAVLQPELMGVLREDLPSLDAQEAFFFSTYLTFGRFSELVARNPDREQLLRRAKRYIAPRSDTELSPASRNLIRQVIVGGMNPFRTQSDTPAQGGGFVNWLQGPSPQFSPDVLSELVRLDELWVQDVDTHDWTTIQLLDDEIIEGRYIHRNLFADPYDITDPELLKRSKASNPLAGHHPFVEFCPNEIEGYFWGRSELHNVALLQSGLNTRIDGIQTLLRLQEDPPAAFAGGWNVTQNKYSKLNKKGAFFTSENPNAKVQMLAPELPQDLWADKREYERMFDDLAGFAPVLQGRGDQGVRSQAQAETLIRTASPRFKTRALKVERSVEQVGALMLAALRARYPTKVQSWAKPGDSAIPPASQPWWKNLFAAPAPGMSLIEFIMADVPSTFSVRVDSHSSSPAFSYESRELAFALANRGAIDNAALIALTHPSHEETLIHDAEVAAIQRAQFMAAHPELAFGKKPGSTSK